MTQLQDWHTWREILQQPAIWRSWFENFDYKTARNWVDHQTFDEIWFCGAGTSAYIGDIIAAGAIGAEGPKLRAVPSTDLVAQPHAYLRKIRPLVVSFGRSGNSAETIGTLDALDALAPTAPRLNITCNGESTLSKRESEGPSLTIVLPDATHDAGFAMTSSFSTMLLTALSIFDRSQNPMSAIPVISDAFEQKLASFIDIAKDQPKRVVYLGTGALGFAAREAALKTLELTAGRIPSMWETTLGFRHGPKSFVCDQTHIVLFKSPSGHCVAYENDLEAEIKAQFPNNTVTALSFAELPNINTAWLAPLALGLAQVQAATWSHNLGFNVDDPFAGKGTLSRVVSGVTLYEVTA
ncbi:MAG: tagatose-bisphosphate aldolase [Paracoccaceae bacterium]